MLTRKEKAVMRLVYHKAMERNKSCIVSAEELMGELEPKLKMQESELTKILELLEYDGYYELVNSEKKDRPVFVISLRQKGEAFQREMDQERRQLIQGIITRAAFSAIGAVVAFIITKIISG